MHVRNKKNNQKKTHRRKTLSEIDYNESALLIAEARRHGRQLPKNYANLGFDLAEMAKSGKLYITVLRGEVGTFSSDNYGHLPLFLFGQYDPKESTVVMIRRFEDGPKINNVPYKTVCSLVYVGRKWFQVSEEELKSSYLYHCETGEPLELESGILFSTASEMFPELRGYLEDL